MRRARKCLRTATFFLSGIAVHTSTARPAWPGTNHVRAQPTPRHAQAWLVRAGRTWSRANNSFSIHFEILIKNRELYTLSRKQHAAHCKPRTKASRVCGKFLRVCVCTFLQGCGIATPRVEYCADAAQGGPGIVAFLCASSRGTCTMPAQNDTGKDFGGFPGSRPVKARRPSVYRARHGLRRNRTFYTGTPAPGPPRTSLLFTRE
jgi:hypothetical protein